MEKLFKCPEGATPINDCSGLIPSWINDLESLNRVEAENIMNALKKYLRGEVNHPRNWFGIKKLKEIHEAMFEDVWDWAGKYRQSNTSIGVIPSFIPLQIAELCTDVISWMESPVELTFLEMAARIHHRLVLIHPFENGNGRFARLVSDRFLLAFRCSFPTWPNQLNNNGYLRTEYIQTLKNADKGNYSPLIDFMKKLGAADPKISELINNKFYHSSIIGEKGLALINALIKNGANPNDETNGHHSLQLAIRSGFPEIAKLLVHLGAKIDIADNSGLTPFQVAVTMQNKVLADFFLSHDARDLKPPGIGYTNYYNLYKK